MSTFGEPDVRKDAPAAPAPRAAPESSSSEQGALWPTLAQRAPGGGAPSNPAQPQGIFARTRPLSVDFNVDGLMGEFETERFKVNDGRVTCVGRADWATPRAGTGSVIVMLLEWGLTGDRLVPQVFGLNVNVGRSETLNWTDLPNGSYYIRIRNPVTQVDAVQGHLDVS